MQNTNGTNFLLVEHDVGTTLTKITSVIIVLLKVVLFAWGGTALGHDQIEDTVDFLEVTNMITNQSAKSSVVRSTSLSVLIKNNNITNFKDLLGQTFLLV